MYIRCEQKCVRESGLLVIVAEFAHKLIVTTSFGKTSSEMFYLACNEFCREAYRTCIDNVRCLIYDHIYYQN